MLCFPHFRPLKPDEEKTLDEDVAQEDDSQRLLQAGMALQKKHLRILAIDETSANRLDLERIISQAGHSAILSCSGMEGLQEMKKAQVDEAYGKKDQCFDLVILGHLYQGISVTKVIQRIRSQDHPCMVLGVANEATTELAVFQSAEVDGILTKPLTAAKLKKAIVGACIMGNIGEFE